MYAIRSYYAKGTNPDASIKAVQAMKTRTLLIGGGYDKGSDYDEWIQAFEGKIKYLVLMGQTREKIEKAAHKNGFYDTVMVESMEEAVEFCKKNADVITSYSIHYTKLYEEKRKRES